LIRPDLRVRGVGPNPRSSAAMPAAFRSGIGGESADERE